MLSAAAITAGSIVAAGAANAAAHVAATAKGGNMVTMKDGAQIYFKDWGTGPNTVVFSHGWPLSADAWEIGRAHV